MIKIILRENKKLIKEMSTHQAVEILNSKASQKLSYTRALYTNFLFF